MCGRTLLRKSPAVPACLGSSSLSIASLVPADLWRSLLLPYMITTLTRIDRNMQKTTTQITSSVVLAWMAPVKVSLLPSRSLAASCTSMSSSPTSAQWPILAGGARGPELEPTSQDHLPLSLGLAPITACISTDQTDCIPSQKSYPAEHTRNPWESPRIEFCWRGPDS